MDNDALLHKYQDENDKLKEELETEKKFSEWLKYFSGYIYRKNKDLYDKASNAAYELLTINQEGEEADERRKEILEQESKQTTSGKKDSKSRVDD